MSNLYNEPDTNFVINNTGWSCKVVHKYLITVLTITLQHIIKNNNFVNRIHKMDTTISNRKKNLISWIRELKDDDTLKVLEFVYQQKKESSNSVELTEELKAAIDEALKSFNEGRGIPHEQVMKNAQKKYPNLKFA